MSKWPFPQDPTKPRENNVVRARKIALAYRYLAQEQDKELQHLRGLLNRIDSLEWDAVADQEAADELKQVLPLQPDGVGELDQRFIAWGERWHADIVVPYEDDDLVTAEEAGKLIHLGPEALTNARLRGAIAGQWMRGVDDIRNRWYFRVADVYAYGASKRGRWVDRD